MRALSASSAPARSIEATARSTSRRSITSEIGTLWTSTSNIDRSITSGLSPWLIVRLPWGSRSISSTRLPISPSETPRLSVVVVFATPPFWLARTSTRVAVVSAPVAVSAGNDAGASGTAVTGSSGSGTGSLIVIGSGTTSSRSGSGACSRAGGAGVAAGRGRSRMRPMTTPRSPRSTRVLQPRSILSIPVVEHVQTADETEAAEVHLA